MTIAELINELHTTDSRIAELRREQKAAATVRKSEIRTELKALKTTALRLDASIADQMEGSCSEFGIGEVFVKIKPHPAPDGRRLVTTRAHPDQKRKDSHEKGKAHARRLARKLPTRDGARLLAAIGDNQTQKVRGSLL